MQSINLKTTESLMPQVEYILADVFRRLKALFPDVELSHIGATAIPGALTKGDVDVLLRVLDEHFQIVVNILKQHFIVKQAANWTLEFASFGDDVSYELPLGIQVVVKDSGSDFFLFLRGYFITHRKALDEYNRLKTIHAVDGPENYWKAKNEFLTKILSLR